MEVTRGEITWHFEDFEVWGTYANGDIWVVGPVTLTEIEPATAYDPGENWWKNGTQLFPNPGNEPGNELPPKPQSIVQGLDNSIYDVVPNFPPRFAYDHTLNIADQLPFTVLVNTSIVSCISQSVPAHGGLPNMVTNPSCGQSRS